MDCINFISFIQNIEKFKPEEFANLFVEFLIKNENCINFTETIAFFKTNYYEYYISIMMLIGKGG
jgi:hypothetical protein